MTLTIRKDAEHSHLAIIDFAQTATPLSSNTDGAISLFDETCLINDETIVRIFTHELIRILADLRDHRPMVPGGIADEMLKLLRTAALDHRCHGFEIGRIGLGQTLQIAHGSIIATPCFRSEIAPISIREGDECLRSPINKR